MGGFFYGSPGLRFPKSFWVSSILQIGILSRILIVDIGGECRVLINPEIIEGEGESILEEGCLSLPNIEAVVKRKQEVL